MKIQVSKLARVLSNYEHRRRATVARGAKKATTFAVALGEADIGQAIYLELSNAGIVAQVNDLAGSKRARMVREALKIYVRKHEEWAAKMNGRRISDDVLLLRRWFGESVTAHGEKLTTICGERWRAEQVIDRMERRKWITRGVFEPTDECRFFGGHGLTYAELLATQTKGSIDCSLPTMFCFELARGFWFSL